jgi:DNA-binding NtrC family response regulator
MARIFLFDDDNILRTSLRIMLTRLGHTVIEAHNGAEGLKLLRYADADLLITDILMPEKEGLEVLLELKRKQWPVKVIAISGGGRVESKDCLYMAKALGAAKVLAKPFTHEVLLAAVNELLAADGTTAPAANNLEAITTLENAYHDKHNS